MRSNFKIYTMSEYLPKRYDATFEQQQTRQEVYNFKDGNASAATLQKFIKAIREIIGYQSTSNFCVCFIPASAHWKTVSRYSALASKIRNEIGCSCSIDTITCPDHESGHIVGKSENPCEDYSVSGCDVRGKKVILIDDIITRGTTFRDAANLVLDAGASDVVGLFLAKTINPDWRAA